MFFGLFLVVLVCYIADQLYHRRRWKMLSKIPGLKPRFLIGNITLFMGSSKPEGLNRVAYFFEHQIGTTLIFLKQKLYILWIARKPILFLTAPETVEAILSSNTALEKGLFYKYMKTWLGGGLVMSVSYSITARSSKPWLESDTIYHMTTDGKAFQKAVKYLHDKTDKVITEKIVERENLSKFVTPKIQEEEFGTKKRLAFLDLLMESGLSKQEMREQVDTFMFAGHDTTAIALSWMSYLLGVYPDVQDKLINEVDNVFGEDKERPVTQEDIKKLKYMDMVIKESQRVYPSVPGVSRTLDKDTEIGGYMIPKGTECFIAIYAVHHHPDHYSNPDVFDPERFSPENSIGRHPYAFIPFSAGPRNCIGQRYALMEQKIMACYILRHFRIQSLDQRDQIKLVPELVLRTDPRLRTCFIPRT